MASIAESTLFFLFCSNALGFCYDSSRGSKIPPPSDLLNVLQLLNDFTRQGPDTDVTAVVFRTLEWYLRKFPEHFDLIFNLIHKSVLKSPTLSVCLLRTINKLRNSNDPQDVANFQPFVLRVADMLTSPTLPPHQLGSFLDLLLSISSYDFVEPAVCSIIRFYTLICLADSFY